jgi:hypothetical protein
MKTLLEMYKAHSPSHKEFPMIAIVARELNKLGIKWEMDENGQIFSLHPNKPVIFAHMDQVSGHKPIKRLDVKGDKIKGDSNLGADDKNGCWIVLRLLEHYRDKVNFVFSTCEEAGGNMTELYHDRKELLKTIPYGLCFDRMGSGDIIGFYNGYCDEDLQEAIEELGKKYGYAAEQGIWSDCDGLSKYVPCVNLSCGYYGAHSKKEYTLYSELVNALEFGKHLIEKLPTTRFKLSDYEQRKSSWTLWGGLTFGKGTSHASQYRRVHLSNEGFQCPDCKSRDVETDQDGEWYYCNHCFNSGATENLTIVEEPDIPEECPECGCTDMTGLYCWNCRRTIQQETIKTKPTYLCPDCGDDLEHDIDRLTGNDFYYCWSCEDWFDIEETKTEEPKDDKSKTKDKDISTGSDAIRLLDRFTQDKVKRSKRDNR